MACRKAFVEDDYFHLMIKRGPVGSRKLSRHLKLVIRLGIASCGCLEDHKPIVDRAKRHCGTRPMESDRRGLVDLSLHDGDRGDDDHDDCRDRKSKDRRSSERGRHGRLGLIEESRRSVLGAARVRPRAAGIPKAYESPGVRAEWGSSFGAVGLGRASGLGDGRAAVLRRGVPLWPPSSVASRHLLPQAGEGYREGDSVMRTASPVPPPRLGGALR